MAIIYYYVLKEKIEDFKQGIDISLKKEKDISVDGIMKPCIFGGLLPKDDIIKNKSEQYSCIELDVNINDCFVLDSDLSSIKNNELYFESIIPLSKYKFGTYRRPEVAIISNIDAKHIHNYKKNMGSPFLIENSDKLYKDNLFEDLRQKYNDFDETILNIFFMLMTSKGKMTLLGKKDVNSKTVYIYKDNSTKKIYTVDIKEGKDNE